MLLPPLLSGVGLGGILRKLKVECNKRVGKQRRFNLGLWLSNI